MITEVTRGWQYNLDIITAQYGYIPLEDTTLDLRTALPAQKVARIIVMAGSGPVVVSGVQESREENKRSLGLLPDLVSYQIGEGEHWLNISQVLIVASGAACVVYWG